MILARSLLLLLLLSGAAQAEVTIRSGEHDTFSRLVFTAPAGTEWTLSEGAESATIALAADALRFDTSEVFARIPRDRLNDAQDQGDGRLFLDLNCNCPIKAFQLNSRVFVVDIQDPAEFPNSSESTSGTKRPASSGPALKGQLALPIVPETRPKSGVVPPLGFRNVSVPYDPALPTAPNPDIAEARTRLIEQLGRAASQGLLNANLESQVEAMDAAVDEALDIASPQPGEDPIVAAEASAIKAAPLINMRATSSMDEALAGAMSRVFGVSKADNCLSDEALDVSAWSTGTGFQQEIGQLNRQLYGEFDRIVPEVAIRLSRYYVHLGFGAEALFVLQLMEQGTEERDKLATMAETLEFASAPGSKAFEGQEMCNTAAALWAVMSQADLEPGTELNTQAILRSFDALPGHLRQYLGPILSEKLRKARNVDTAQSVMRIVTRGSREMDSAADLEVSRIASARGDNETAAAGLEDVVSSDSPPSPEALVNLIDLRIEQGEPIESEYATLAASYAFEFRESEIGVALQRVHVLALVDSGQFSSAMQGLADISGELLPETGKATRSAVLDAVTDHAEDDAFLMLVIPYLESNLSSIGPKTENTIAERLMTLGITAHVGRLLTESILGQEGRERRILRSRLAALENRPRNAIAHLLGLEGEDVDLLRADVFSSLGEYDRARALYDLHGHQDKARQMALLARDWPYLRENGSAVLASVATNRLQEDVEDFAEPGLALSHIALAHSETTRDEVNELVNLFQVDAAVFGRSQ